MILKQIENGLDLQEITKNIAAVYDTLLLPGESIPPHYHPDFEELYYVLSGYGLMSIGEEKQEISRGDVVYIPAPAPHTLMNTGNVPLRFVTVSVSTVSNRKMMLSLILLKYPLSPIFNRIRYGIYRRLKW